MSRFDIDFLAGNSGLVWVILLCLLFWVASYLYYRRTTPPQSKLVRSVLLFLRIVSLSALFLSLAQPVLKMTSLKTIKKKGAVLVDRSHSMTLPLNGSGTEIRSGVVNDLLSGNMFAPLRDNLDLEYFALAESLTVAESTETLTGTATDFGAAFDKLKMISSLNRHDYVFLLSDGRVTLGDNPKASAASFGRPIHTIAIGDSIRKDDIALTDLTYNKIMYVGKKSEIEAEIAQSGIAGDQLNLRLSQNGRILTQISVTAPGDGKSGRHKLSLTPTQPGKMIVNVAISGGESDQNLANNSRTIVLNVLKSRLELLLYSSSLNQEYAFLKRFLNGRPEYAVTSVIDAPGMKADVSLRLGQRFPNSLEKLNRYDLIIMIDPNLSRLNNQVNNITSYLSERGGGLLVLAGENYFDSAPNSRLEKIFPLAVSSWKTGGIMYGDYNLVPDARMIFHPALKLADAREEIYERWQNQPPFKQILPIDSLRSSAVTLAYYNSASDRLKSCGLAYRRLGPGKILFSTASPFWHWAFYPIGVGGDAVLYADFFEAVIRWLTISDESDRINFKPVSELFQNGEQTIFSGTAYDMGFRPITGGSGDLIIVSSAGDSSLTRILPDPTRSAGYIAEVGILPPESYSYRAELFAEDIRLGRFEGKFAVSAIDRELAFGSVDWNLLSEMSSNSGGQFATYKDISPIIEGIDTKPTSIEESNEYRLWDNLVMLLIILVALCAEWIIRKQRQLL